jgi:hypothetical protein
MGILGFWRCVYGVCASAVLLTGCGAMQTSSSSPPALPQTAEIRPRTSSTTLLYVVDAWGNDVEIYTYPGQTLVGTLTGFASPSGLCVDKTGNVFVTDYRAGDIVEYAHGGTSPIATLADPNSGPAGCAVDPGTGNLAVANSYVSANKYEHGNIAIYEHASGTPTIYDDFPSVYYFDSCTYDENGNLYADGDTPSRNKLVELPKSRASFTHIALDKGLRWVWGGVQWDGKYVARQRYDRNHNAIYRIAVSGSKGRIVARVATRGPKFIGAFWIEGDTVIVPNGQRKDDEIGTWSYPAGGKARTEFKVPGTYFIAAVVSSP